MKKRKTFLKQNKSPLYSSSSRNLRLRRLKHRKQQQFERHSLQFVVQEICC